MTMRIFLLIYTSAAVGLGGCGLEENHVQLAGDGAAVRVQLRPFGVQIDNGEGRRVLTSFPGGSGAYGAPAAGVDDPLFEGQVLPGWDGYRTNVERWQRAGNARLLGRSGDTVSLRLGGMSISISVEGTRVRIRTDATPLVDHDPDGKHTKTSWSFLLGAGEHFFGGGERYTRMDHRGASYYSWAEEAGVGRGEAFAAAADNPIPNGPSMTYFPVPFFLSSAGYGFHVDTTFRTEVHFGSERPDAWRLAADTNAFDLVIYVNDDPLATLDQYTEDTGRPPVPAQWVFGPRRRVNINRTIGGVPEWQLLRDRGVPTTGVDDSMHMLPHNAHLGREATLRTWIDTLHDNGFKVMAYNNPYVSLSRDAIITEREFGIDNGYFATLPNGDPASTIFGSGGVQTLATIDLTNPDAVGWFQQLMQRSLDLGYDGWMHDFGEYVGRRWNFHDGRRGDEVHNEFPVLSARAAFELLERERPDDYLFFVRSGYAGTQGVVPAVWGGDPEATFDPVQGLPASLMGGLNLGLSGVPYFGSCISGFKCLTDDPKDKEMYLRWTQLGAVSPIMMDQNACLNISTQIDKWTLWSDDETIAVYGEMARLHTRLQPYFLVLATEAHRTGAPLMRHPFLTHPGEAQAWTAEGAYFLGPSLYAAPVIRRGARTRRVWLPPGHRYVDRRDFRAYDGGTVQVLPAPLTELPLLSVAGEMLPLLDASIETLAPATEPAIVTLDDVADRLDVQVVLAPGQSAHMLLADGTELRARRGPDLGNPDALTRVEATTLAICDNCYRREAAGDVERVRLSSPNAQFRHSRLGDLELRADGGPPRRIRWDVARLDP